jgi:hypothetical protein
VKVIFGGKRSWVVVAAAAAVLLVLLGKTYQNEKAYNQNGKTLNKVPQNIPKGHEIHQTNTKHNIFHFKALQNIPKFGILYENVPSGYPVLYVRTVFN